MSDVTLEELASLAKRRGFIYQGSEIYGGLSGTWDYGPLGVALKRNIMNLWWKMFVDERDDMFGVDAAILMNQKVWQASGHVDTFSDPLVECSECKSRFRTDHLLEDAEKFIKNNSDISDKLQKYTQTEPPHLVDYEKVKKEDPELYKRVYEAELGPDSVQLDEASLGDDFLKEALSSIKCPVCGEKGKFSEPRQFNMMFKTFVGPNQGEEVTIGEPIDGKKGNVNLEGRKAVTYEPSSVSYLRPETAQGIFTNYKNVVDSFYPDLPFGLAQQGKAFRNEISPRDFVFRSREFEQMEIEYFVHPEKWEEAFEHWVEKVHEWCDALGLPKEAVHELEVPDEDRAHYSKRTIDFEFDFPHGRKELLGLAYRTDFDLMNIQNNSGKSMDYTVKGTNEKFVPHVIEPSFGVERALMAVLATAYTVDEVNGEKRVFLKLPTHLAPIKFAVSPLLRNKEELVSKAKEVYAQLKKQYGAVIWDDNGNIGKRYRRSDEIGVPKHITIDFQTIEDGTVTVRDRDTTEQTRVKIEDIAL